MSDDIMTAYVVREIRKVLEIFHKLQDDLGDEDARYAATLTLAVCVLIAGPATEK